MNFVDTHCHIQTADASWEAEDFTRTKWLQAGKASPGPLIEAATAAGVTRLIAVGTTLSDSHKAVELAQARDGIWASVGLHPHEAASYISDQNKLDEFSALAGQSKVVAIGECGLDYFYEHSPKATQLELLHFQLQLAHTHNLPVVFHVREAFDDFWPVFEQYPGTRGVLHSFTDTAANMHKALQYGLYIGVNGIATFAKNPAQLAVYQAIPLTALLLETDAPFLTPTPYRGSICEPSHVAVTANFLSQLRQELLDKLAEATTKNAVELFNLR
jgi:TatD DNase family protein